MCQGAVAPTWTPTNGIQYTVNTTYGDGKLVAKVLDNSSDNMTTTVSSLSPGTQYSFTIVPFGGLTYDKTFVYNTDPTIPSTEGTTGLYHWNAATGGDWTVSTNWTPTRTTPDASDVLHISSLGIRNIINVPTQSISTLLIEGATFVTLNPPAANSRTLTTSGTVTIAAGSSLTIAPDMSVTVGTNLVNSAGVDGLVLKSSGTASAGSLIVGGSITGSGTVERKTDENRWSLISAPANQLIKDFVHFNDNIPLWQTVAGSAGTTTDHYGMASYNTGMNKYNNYYEEALNFNCVDAATMLGFGKGYLIRTITDATANQTITFKGAVKVGEQSVSFDQSGYMWNLIGNPYTSAIKLWDGTMATAGALSTNFMDYNFDYIEDANFGAYIFNGATYTIVNLTNNEGQQYYASIGQGFFVKAKAGASLAYFEPAMQFHQVSTLYKAAETPHAYPTVKLEAILNGAKVSTDILFIEGTTKGLDKGYYAGILKADPSFAVYTKLVQDIGIEFQIQYLPTNQYNNMVIPVGLDSKTGGDVTFSAESPNLEAGCKVILEDKANNTFTDLSKNSYKTAIEANTSTSDRFFLHTSDLLSGVEDQVLQGKLTAYAKGNTEIRVLGEVSGQSVATLYDTAGKPVITKTLSGGNLNIIGLPNLHSGVYLLNINDKGTAQTIKVRVRN